MRSGSSILLNLATDPVQKLRDAMTITVASGGRSAYVYTLFRSMAAPMGTVDDARFLRGGDHRLSLN